MANQLVRNRYVADGAGVVPPARLLIMLYDRLVLDLEQAKQACETNQIAVANAKLSHAQDIVLELHSALDMDAWDGAASLSQLYSWFATELVEANVRKDARRVGTTLRMVRQLQGAWQGAYEKVIADQHAAAVAATSTTPAAATA